MENMELNWVVRMLVLCGYRKLEYTVRPVILLRFVSEPPLYMSRCATDRFQELL